MVEVFKTNVDNTKQAQSLVDKIHNQFPDYKVNFDLEDYDNILRVECAGYTLDSEAIIEMLEHVGYHAEVLPDVVESREGINRQEAWPEIHCGCILQSKDYGKN